MASPVLAALLKAARSERDMQRLPAHELAPKGELPKAKREGKAKGKQFVKQPKSIANKTKKFRANEGGMASKFPDLTGDGKVTQKDILKGRGVSLSKGGMPKKKGYAKGGKISDMRKTGMFYGGMAKKGK